MATPLTPAPSTTLNFSTPPTSQRYETYEVRTFTTHSSTRETVSSEDGDSSPFMPQAKDDQENPAAAGAGPAVAHSARPGSRILSGSELSPLKILQDRQQHQLPPVSDETGTTLPAMPPPPTPRSPRKMTGPEKRFPIRVSAAVASPRSPEAATPRAASISSSSSSSRPHHHERQMSLEDVMRENEGLKHAINIFEDEVSVLEDGSGTKRVAAGEDKNTVGIDDYDKDMAFDDEMVGPDDTMISTFSAFSGVPNLTMLAQMRSDSPTRFSTFGGATPRANPDSTSSRTPRPGSLPNRSTQHEQSGNTTSLMDFTEQLRVGAYQRPESPSRRGNASSPSKGRGPSAPVAATPQRHSMVNLLDFDIPPLPTPRSIPTITPRELESLKSGFLSEISSLKASLSGKEAEVSSLKTAVGDAEKRVGESLEQLREVRNLQDALASEREGWERRGREMEAVLRKVKGEIVMGQREREELEAKLDEADKRREAAEMMAQEAESKMAGMRAGKASADAAAAAGGSSTPDRIKSPGSSGTNREVEIAVERVARELHALYKSKHETKVSALKKSYENRWEKRVRELETRADELARENEELRLGRDATMTRVDPARLSELEAEREAERARDAAQIRGLEAEVEKLEAYAGSVKADNVDLRAMLEKERVEKGELVILAEEMMGMQSFVAAAPATAETKTARRTSIAYPSTPSSAAKRVPPSPGPGTAGKENGTTGLRMNRASGLRAPAGAAASRIGRAPPHGRTGSSSSGSGLARPGSGMGVRSGLMTSIEKMGSYRGRGE